MSFDAKHILLWLIVCCLAQVCAAALLLEDDFDDGSINTGIWTVTGTPLESGTLLIGDDSGDRVESIQTFQYEPIVIKLRNIFDSRNQGNYSRYTLGYAGFGSSRYILARNDNAGGGRLNVEVYYAYLQGYVACYLNIGDGQTHDVDVTIDWQSNLLHITMDDLATPDLDVDWSTTDSGIIPSDSMPAVTSTNQLSAGESWDTDYIRVGAGSSVTISGTVTSDGSGLDGVEMTALPSSPVTSGGGIYSDAVSYGWSGTVIPVKTGYIFNPLNRTYSNVTSDQPGEDYTATATYTISGTVTIDGSGLDGVVMTALPNTPVTNGSGFYSDTVLDGFTATVTPSKSGYVFDPDERDYNNVNSHMPDQNYIATEQSPQWGYWSGDLNQDRIVDFVDFSAFAGLWMLGYDMNDLDRITEQWLYCSDSNNPDCCEPPSQAYYANGVLYLPGDVEIDILTSGNEFLGIGTITIRDTQIRNGQNVWDVYISNSNVKRDSTSHYSYQDILLTAVNIHGDGMGADVVTELKYSPSSSDTLTWTFRSVTDEWDGLNASGFSYYYHFQSSDRRVHKLMENNSFSLNGSVNGNMYATQGERYGRPGCYAVTIDSSTLLEPWWNYPSQRIYPESRMAAEDPMDYLEDSNQTFVRYISEMAIVYKNLYRNPGDSEITVEDWYATPLTYDFTTAPMEIRLYDRSGPNAWIQARDHMSAVLYADAGLTGYEQDPKPRANTNVGSLASPIDNQTVINWLNDHGITGVHVWCRWKTDWSETCSGCGPGCLGQSHAVREMDWATNKFDVNAMAEFCQMANASDIEVCLWTPGGHLSFCSFLRSDNPTWITYEPGGIPFDYVYPEELGGSNWNQGYGDYMISSLADRLLEVPFAGIWLDSFQVFGVETINYGDGLWTPNLDGAVDFVKRAKQNLGLIVMAETGFPLALASSTGEYKVNDPNVGIIGKEWVAYKTNKYHCYVQGDEWRSNYDPIDPATYFRLLAYKAAVILLYGSEWEDLGPVAAYANKCYKNALQYMKKCVHLGSDQGTVWYNEDRSVAVVWSFGLDPVDLGRNIATAVDACWGYSFPFSGTTVTPGAFKVAIVTFAE